MGLECLTLMDLITRLVEPGVHLYIIQTCFDLLIQFFPFLSRRSSFEGSRRLVNFQNFTAYSTISG